MSNLKNVDNEVERPYLNACTPLPGEEVSRMMYQAFFPMYVL